MSENPWYQATCYLDDLNELLHALWENTNSPLTAHEPISNALVWWIPVLGPATQRGLHAVLNLHQRDSLSSKCRELNHAVKQGRD